MEGTEITFDPPDARGPQVKIQCKKLSAKNDQFGPHEITATLNANRCIVKASVKVKTFYASKAKNNPEGKFPNWFYY